MDPSAAVPAGLVAAWVAVLGATVGSFLNVVIARVPAGLSVARPRSRCPRCETPIAWYDNVPVISWVLLRAKCRACGLPISARYPAVELLGAAAALAAWWRQGFGPRALAEFVFVALLLALAAIDLDTWLLPHALTRPLIALGLVAAAAGLAPATGWRSSFLGAALGFGAFWLVARIGERMAGREALGEGDIWLLCGLGAWLGAPALLPVVLLASLQGVVVGVALIALGKAQPGPEPRPPVEAPPPSEAAPEPAGQAAPDAPAPANEEEEDEEDWVPPRNAVPFGPFLALGALEWLYLGGLVIQRSPELRLLFR